MIDTRQAIKAQTYKGVFHAIPESFLLVSSRKSKGKQTPSATLVLSKSDSRALYRRVGKNIEALAIKDGDMLLIVLRKNPLVQERRLAQGRFKIDLTRLLPYILEMYGGDVKRIEAVSENDVDERGDKVMVVMLGKKMESISMSDKGGVE